MKRIGLLVVLCAVIVTSGCGSDSGAEVVFAGGPLTVEQWKELEVVEKYEPETLDRLKLSYPKLEKEKNWNKFMREVVVPERRVDIPTEY